MECLILAAGLVQQFAVVTAGGDERIDELSALALGIHRVLVQLTSRRVLEAIEHVGTEATVEVLVFLVGHRFDKHGGIKVDE